MMPKNCVVSATTFPQTEVGDPIVRRARPTDATAISELFSIAYRNSSHPFQSVQDVSKFLADSRNVQIVAEHGKRLVSSMAMTYYPWNNSYELGRALTCPDYRRQGLAAALMQGVVDQVAQGDVIFGFPRVRRIVDLCRALDPPMIVAGHDAGRNVANGNREVHLIVYCIARHARFGHVTPPKTEIAGSRYVQERIYAGLGLNSAPGEYPHDCFVGKPSQDSASLGTILLDYDESLPGGTLEILGSIGKVTGPERICRQLDLLPQAFPCIQHTTATVLADKTELIRGMCNIGFEISAYLPAWYRLDRFRYDCVQLARRAYSEKPVAQGFEEILHDLETELAAITLPNCAGLTA